MKRFYFLLIGTLIGVQVFAQDTWKDIWCDTWNVMEYDLGMGDKTRETWHHYLAQDTIIDGQTYTCVVKRSTLDETREGRYAIVRFSEDKKVYAFIGDREYLVYDFTVQMDDTITTIVGANWGTKLQQLRVHEVKIDEETNLKTIILHLLCPVEGAEFVDECCQIDWIEGVGDTQGFLMGYPICDWVGGVGYMLLCAYKNDELKYYDPTYGCEYNTTSAVDDAPAPKSSFQKVLQDNQLLIQSADKTYNVMGMEVGE